MTRQAQLGNHFRSQVQFGNEWEKYKYLLLGEVMSYVRSGLLFHSGTLSDELESRVRKIHAKVDSIAKDQFLATPDDLLIEHLEPEFLFVPLELYEDSMQMEYSEIEIDVSKYPDRNLFGDPGPILVSGIRVSVQVPYSGDYQLWSLQSNPWQRVFPRAKVSPTRKDGVGFLEVTVEQPTGEPQEQIKQRVDETLRSIRFFIDAQRKQIEGHNRGIRDFILQALQARRNRFKEHDQIVNVLKIPLKRKEGVPTVKPLLLQRKLVRPLPPSPNSGYKPEPGITSEDYDHILSVIRHEGRTFEVTPKTLFVHDEEELRDILLAHLNGHYHGDATGETFRRSGKTDIRIETDKRAAFIGECKIWHGQKELIEAIDQLLRYLTWRDCKASLIIFNKNNSRFSDLLVKVPEALRTHSNFRRDLGSLEVGEWRFEFASMEDELRRVIVHIFLFNLYVKKQD